MIVVADLEGTLTVGATWRGVGRYLMEHGRAGRYWTFFALHFPAAMLARTGITDIQAMRDRWMEGLARPMRGLSDQRLVEMGEWVVEQELWPKRRQHVISELEQHRRAGARVILVSGTYQHVLAAFARRIGAEALGTAVVSSGNPPVVRVASPSNTGPVKVQRIRAAAGNEPIYAAYGDSAADIPMLELSGHPIAVHPEPPLRKVAAFRGWRISE